MIQTNLWQQLEAEEYEVIEKVFDTAIASVMAHLTGVDITEVAREAGQDAAAPVLQSAT